jgi:hypothetical protein
MKLRRPVMGDEEAAAVITVLRAVRGQRLLVDHDDRLIGAALEALEVAPVEDGDKVAVRPGGSELGPFARQSETSRRAALRNYPRSGSQRERVLAALAASTSLTREELATELRLPDNSVRPRVRELLDGEWIQVAKTTGGVERTRKTALGNDSEVLELTPKAQAYLQRHPELAGALA